MQKMLLVFVLVITWIIEAGNALGQQNNGSFFSPVTQTSPGASAKGNYKTSSVEMSTGSGNADIPLTELKLRENYTIPLSLHYATNGVKVDDMAGQVGTDFSLTGLYSIRRTILDDPDEFSKDETRRLVPGVSTDSINLSLHNGITSGNDLQPDLFTLSTPNFSGKFFLRNDSAIFLNSNTSYKAVRIPAAFPNSLWKVTDGMGNILWYGGAGAVETSKSSTICPVDGYVPDETYYPTAWHLKSIITPFKDTASFVYDAYSVHYTSNVLVTKVLSSSTVSPGCGCTAPTNQACDVYLDVNAYKLNYIKTTSNAKVTFGYRNRPDNTSDYLLSLIDLYQSTIARDSMIQRFSLEYSFASGKQRPFLTGVKLRAGNLTDSMSYKMMYDNINGLPDRLVRQTDGFGYYNASTTNLNINPTVAKYGTMIRLEYPTGGYDSLTYESNTVYASHQVPYTNYLASLSGNGLSDHSLKAYTAVRTLRKSDGDITVSGYCAWQLASAPDLQKMQIVVLNHATGATLYSSPLIYPSQTSPFTATFPYTSVGTNSWFGANDTLVVDLRLEVYGEDLSAQCSFQQTSYTYSYYNDPFAGVRVASIASNNNFGPPMIKKYNYNVFGTSNSSGRPVTTPLFTEELYTQNYCSNTTYSICYAKIQQNSSLVDLFSHGALPIYYEDVTETYGNNMENGATRFEYELRLPIQPSTFSTAQVGGFYYAPIPFISGPFTLLRDEFALETARSLFKKSGDTLKLVQKVNKTYKVIASPQSRNGYAFRQRVFKEVDFTPASFYSYFDMTKFTFYQNFVGLATEEQILFSDDNKQFKVKTNYFYDYWPLNTNISRTQNVTSKGDTSTYYANYATNYPGTTVYDTMVKRNMVDYIVEGKEFLNSTMVGATKVNYVFTNSLKNMVVKANYQIQKGVNPLVERYTNYRFDTIGNILESSKTNDAHEVFVYGYSKQLIVAKIVGSTYAAITPLFNQSVLDNPSSDQAVRDEIAKIRNAFTNSLAQVTTYTYIPLVGRNSEVDINGRHITYHYDAMGRLWYTKDKDGRIVQVKQYGIQVPIAQ
ncbi:hypothetical protein [Pedobacter paludis]|uniref:Uncharacterized protein n=1 Tax=Pedobacter paludis TaxID=2203212 RepID=A0A317F0L3_9SPHI|nr:hypothetical protein [Pedobacter paludis]PWS32252.1 hypothetical protein DF947_10820 [Pedobacter paludis]